MCEERQISNGVIAVAHVSLAKALAFEALKRDPRDIVIRQTKAAELPARAPMTQGRRSDICSEFCSTERPKCSAAGSCGRLARR